MDASGDGKAADLRAPLIAAGAILLATLVGAVVLLGGSSSSSSYEARAAPARCLSLWNEDPRARAFGAHNSSGHGYELTQVTYVDGAGAPAPSGSCAVVFAAASLDPEPFAAARAYRRGRWISLRAATDMTDLRLAELQNAAREDANTILRSDGTLAPI